MKSEARDKLKSSKERVLVEKRSKGEGIASKIIRKLLE